MIVNAFNYWTERNGDFDSIFKGSSWPPEALPYGEWHAYYPTSIDPS